MAPIPTRNAGALEAGYPSAAQEKASLEEDTAYRAHNRQQLLRPADQTSMGSIRKMFLAMLVCLLVSFGLTAAMMPIHQRGEPCHKSKGEAQAPEAVGEHSRFSSLLGAASADSLHEILQKYFPNRYRHGVWPSEHQAMEAVHRDDAALATSMVQLAKRQDSGNNATSTTESPPPQDTSTPPPVTETTVVTVTETGGATTTSTIVTVTTPPPVDTTSSQPPPPPESTSTSDLLPTTSSEADVPTTTTTTTSTSTAPPPSSTDTSPGTLTSPGSATTSSLTPAPSSTLSSKGVTSSGRSSSSSSRRGISTTSTTKSPSTKSSSQSLRMITSTFTSTLSGGEVSIVTRTSFVGGNPAQSDAATSTRPDGSLQTNAAESRSRRVVEAVVGALIGGAMLL